MGRVILFVLAAAGLAAAQTAPFAALPEVDWSRVQPRDFTDDELDLPFYLAHFRELAGSVVESGPNRGFIGISVWRRKADNQPHNARIMENILSLAWFYSANRPWNPYYRSEAVRQRLEAAMEFWRRMQSPEGKFSEYKPQGWNLAATAFATKFMGEALRLLPRDFPGWRETAEADRKAIAYVLTDAQFIQFGKSFSNQYTNVWPGALDFFKLHPGDALEKLFWTRVMDNMRDFQSPAGFFYEADGPDWGYNMTTHQSNLRGTWRHVKGTSRASALLEHERRWFEWLAWNAVPEPGYSGWVLNRAVETRQQHGFFEELSTPLAESIPLARAFAANQEERQLERQQKRRELEANWPKFGALKMGEFTAWSPYVFLYRGEPEWLPNRDQQAAARSALPYMAQTRLVKQLKDSRHPAVYTYVRRPGYYAAFNSGKRLKDQQRLGLGLLWTKEAGTVLQSQTATDDAAWGTRASSAKHVYEAGDVKAMYGPLTAAAVTVQYPLGTAGEKTVRFGDDVRVTVRHAGAFTEVIPLLGGEAVVDAGRVIVPVGARTVVVRFPLGVKASAKRVDGGIGEKLLTAVRLEAAGTLSYSIAVE